MRVRLGRGHQYSAKDVPPDPQVSKFPYSEASLGCSGQRPGHQSQNRSHRRFYTNGHPHPDHHAPPTIKEITSPAPATSPQTPSDLTCQPGHATFPAPAEHFQNPG